MGEGVFLFGFTGLDMEAFVRVNILSYNAYDFNHTHGQSCIDTRWYIGYSLQSSPQHRPPPSPQASKINSGWMGWMGLVTERELPEGSGLPTAPFGVWRCSSV